MDSNDGAVLLILVEPAEEWIARWIVGDLSAKAVSRDFSIASDVD